MFQVAFCHRSFGDGKRWFFPGATNLETGEQVARIGHRDGETTNPFDVFVYTDGRRVVPFIFADHMDFGEVRGLTLASVYISGIGQDLKLQKSHTFHDYISYDARWFSDASFHGHTFASSEERSDVTATIRSVMRDWLFWQLTAQATKSSRAHMVSRRYFPCYVAEAISEDQASPDNPYEHKRRDQYFRMLSAYRGPFIEWETLMRKREFSRHKWAPKGMEKRSPWGGKYVDAIVKDCADKRADAAADAVQYLDQLERRQINEPEAFFEAIESIEAPFAFEKLTAAMLRCESLPGQPFRMGPDPCSLFCEERGVAFLRRFADLDGWPSTEGLLAHLVALWTNRVRDKTSGGYHERAKNGVVGPGQGVGGRRLDGSTYPSS